MTSRKSLAHNRLPKDRILYCDRCGISFLWSGEEQQLATRPTVNALSDDHSTADIGSDTQANADEPNTAHKLSGKTGTAKVPTHCAGCRVLMPGQGRERGIVKWYNPRKRFGFITREDGTEIFAHGSKIKNAKRLKDGLLVEYGSAESKQGSTATDIQVLEQKEVIAELDDSPDGEPKRESVEESIRQALAKGSRSRHSSRSRGSQQKGSHSQSGKSTDRKPKDDRPNESRRKGNAPQQRPPKKKVQKKRPQKPS